MDENLAIWQKSKKVPESAKKTIQAGKLKGFTDINPVWRIKKLTELFGPCGKGWYTEITKQWLEEKEGVVCAFCNINLYVKFDDEWSKPIPGTGGNKFVSQTRNGADVSDECYKMAYTDAIGVAAKSLGIGADTYWDADKYNNTEEEYSKPGNKIINDRDVKELAKEMVKAYGNQDNALSALQRLTNNPNARIKGMTYDEYHWLKELVYRDTHRVECAGESDTKEPSDENAN